MTDHPNVLNHKALAIVSPAVEGYTPGGIPFGSASGYIYQNAVWVLRRRYAVPYPVFVIKDYDAKYYAIMRFAIEQRLSLIATPNPSTILRLATTADSHRDQLYKDIHDGTISKDFDISSEVRQQVRPFLKPNPERARELERIAARLRVSLQARRLLARPGLGWLLERWERRVDGGQAETLVSSPKRRSGI